MLVKIDEGESALRADDRVGAAEALVLAENALQPASLEVWRPAHRN